MTKAVCTSYILGSNNKIQRWWWDILFKNNHDKCSCLNIFLFGRTFWVDIVIITRICTDDNFSTLRLRSLATGDNQFGPDHSGFHSGYLDMPKLLFGLAIAPDWISDALRQCSATETRPADDIVSQLSTIIEYERESSAESSADETESVPTYGEFVLALDTLQQV